MDYTAISAWAACAAVVGAFLILWVHTRHTKRLTCLQLFMQLAAQYDSPDMQQARARLAGSLLSDPDTLEIDSTLLVFYENISILNRRKILDHDLLFNTFSVDVQNYWTALRHYVNHVRATFDDPSFFMEFEQLNNYFVLFQQKVVPSSKVGTPEAVRHFLRDERRRGGQRG